MAYAEHHVAADGWAVSVGAEDGLARWVVLTVDEDESVPESPCAGVAMTAQQAREVAALLVDAANKAEGKAT